MDPAIERSEIQAAVSGDPRAVRHLVDALAPVIRVAVARILYRHRHRSRGRTIDQDAEDMVQEVFAALFERNCRVLRSWDPERGASLATFTRLVAERTALSILRSGRRSPFTEDPTIDADLEIALGHDVGLDTSLVSRDLLVRLHDRLKEKLSARGYQLFWRLFVEEASVETVATDFGLARDAVYAWRHRFVKVVASARSEITEGASMREASPGAVK